MLQRLSTASICVTAAASAATADMFAWHVLWRCCGIHVFQISATCSLQEEWSLTAEESWISGFIDRSQPRLAVQLLQTTSQTSVAHQAAGHTKPISFSRRCLQQAPQTYQATVAFTLFFPSQSPSSQATVAQDTSNALQQATAPLNTITTIAPVASPNALTLNVSVLFPPGNTVSATPSQATLAAVTLTSALTTNPAQALPSLSAKDGAFLVQGTSISNALVPQGSPSSTQRASPLITSTLPTAPAVPSSSFSPSPTTSLAVQTMLPSLPPSPFQTPPPPVLPTPPSPISLAGLPSQVSMCLRMLSALLRIDGNTVFDLCFSLIHPTFPPSPAPASQQRSTPLLSSNPQPHHLCPTPTPLPPPPLLICMLDACKGGGGPDAMTCLYWQMCHFHSVMNQDFGRSSLLQSCMFLWLARWKSTPVLQKHALHNVVHCDMLCGVSRC